MRSIFIFIILCISLNLVAQRHEIGLMLGQPNLIADVGKTNYIQPFPSTVDNQTLPYSLGLLYRFNFNPQMGLRLNLNYNHINFSDREAKEDYRVRRNRTGQNDIGEGSIFFEYNFFDINDEQEFGHSPYIFTGFGAYMYKNRLYRFSHELYTDASGNPITPSSPTDFKTTVYYDEESKSGFNLPFGVGYKFKFNYNWVLSLEVGVRYTDTDNLDYSWMNEDNFEDERRYVAPDLLADNQYYDEIVNRESNFKAAQITGNLNSTDWYVITGVSLTYAFGRPPCFCKN